MVKNITSFNEFDSLINGGKPSPSITLTVFRFPVHRTDPYNYVSILFSSIAGQDFISSMEFCKVGIDEQSEIAQKYDVRDTLACKVFKNGNEVGGL
ncbi:hypothetical protein M407DRAFT_31199 [Tulasnella calospora MUT 4182]|uniref:Uncharacterized protein n=1 Tax=Tulasnella calospora MUT 4182 TaxID=1051891 RepID=A0A0C3LCC9_9AGAM|nr:hypothetical protein M407DRAFT_31199 [Tulasnella calospora MUT 4182]